MAEHCTCDVKVCQMHTPKQHSRVTMTLAGSAGDDGLLTARLATKDEESAHREAIAKRAALIEWQTIEEPSGCIYRDYDHNEEVAFEAGWEQALLWVKRERRENSSNG